MTTFIKTKFKKSDDQMNIDKYRVAANIKEYQNNLPKFMEKRQLFHFKNVKNQQVAFHKVANAKGIIPKSLSSIGQF